MFWHFHNHGIPGPPLFNNASRRWFSLSAVSAPILAHQEASCPDELTTKKGSLINLLTRWKTLKFHTMSGGLTIGDQMFFKGKTEALENKLIRLTLHMQKKQSIFRIVLGGNTWIPSLSQVWGLPRTTIRKYHYWWMMVLITRLLL